MVLCVCCWKIRLFQAPINAILMFFMWVSVLEDNMLPCEQGISELISIKMCPFFFSKFCQDYPNKCLLQETDCLIFSGVLNSVVVDDDLQILGYGWAGMLRKYLVEPAEMWWPSNLAQVSLFRSVFLL